MPRTRLAAPVEAPRVGIVPILSILGGSAFTLVPLVAQAPVIPPFGLMMLIAWKIRRPGLWPAWAGLPLGLIDDLMSGQPLGSAAALWTGALFALGVADRNLLWRDHVIDWLIGAIVLLAAVLGGWAMVALAGAAPPPWIVLPQAAAAILCLPLCVRLASGLDGGPRPR